ncbi:MAG: cysteine hydrolase [Myxococcales bacterium]|nr:cysteine hydrolase [Myxococcales bacterium]
MRRIFVDVDTQYDFCAPGGALFVEGAPKAAEQCARIVQRALDLGAPIVGSVDSHAHDAWEFATNDRRGPHGEKPNFPPHCVKGTRGWLKLEATLTRSFVFVPVDAPSPRVPDGTDAVYFEKEVYSLFANPNAARWLDALCAGQPAEFVVFGVATDYCVRAAALDSLAWARSRGGSIADSKVIVVEDAIAGVARESTERALAELRAAGVSLQSYEQLFAR